MTATLEQTDIPSPSVDELETIERDGETWTYFVTSHVPVSTTYADRYQRPLNERWIRKRVEDFRPEMLGTITISLRARRSKAASLVDGQHRVELCKRVKRSHIAAVVFVDLTVQQEARLFSDLQQGRRGITPFQRFQADIVAGKREQRHILAILSEWGLELSESQDAPGYIKCVAALEKIYRDNSAEKPTRGEERLRMVLQVLQRAWRDMPGARNERLVSGLWQFIKDEEKMGAVNVERLVDRLASVTPSYINERARDLRSGVDTGGTLPGFVAQAITNVYRRRKR